MQRDPKSDGFVECSECGHLLEQHIPEGCDICSCPADWTADEVRAYRLSVGLPAE